MNARRALAVGLLGFAFSARSGAQVLTLLPTGDTYLRQGAPNQSQGAETFLRLQESGNNRPLVQFDAQSLLAALSGAILVSARLELHIVDNGRNWGRKGQLVGAHRLSSPWMEAGATWNCPSDANPSNHRPDCSGQWAGGQFAATATAIVLHTNGLDGWVRFDVTADVAAFISGTPNFGWLLKKTDETHGGRVDYDSREGTPGKGPRLVVVFEPAATPDTTRPELSVTSPQEGSLVTAPQALVSGTTTDDGRVVSVTVNDLPATLEAGRFQATVALAEGFNEIAVAATDEAGNRSVILRNVTLDRTPPRLAVATPLPEQLFNQAEVRVAGAVSDENGLASLTVREQPVPVAGDRFETEVAVNPGSNRISLRAVDRAGNVTDAGVPVTRFDLPEVGIHLPQDLSFLASTTVDVSGTVDPTGLTVAVNGVPALVSGATFVAREVPLIEGGNLLTATATDATGHVGTDTIDVVRDLTAPRLAVTTPEEGATLFEPMVSVSGMVNDLVAGTVNASDARVSVNGVQAVVANRSFVADGVPLSPGANVLLVEATDASGNVGHTSVRVNLAPPTVPRILVESGNRQEAGIGAQLSQPLVVSVLDAHSQPVAGQPVLFKVRGTNGMLDGGRRRLVAVTDVTGRASAHFTLGTRAGAGSQRVEATASGFQGVAVFAASALPGAPALLVVDSGDQQVGIAGQELPRPMVAVVTDAGHNRLAGVAVGFQVVQGSGRFAGDRTEALEFTDSDGRVIVPFRTDRAEGIANNVVEATIEGLESSPVASFVASGRAAGEASATSVSGVVLDNSNLPVAGATLRILDTPLTARSDASGLFRIDQAPVGAVRLIVDGSTVERAGSWPTLEYVLTTIPGRDNTPNMPIYLLPLDLGQGVTVDETHGGTLALPEIPGFALEIAPGSVTFPGGGRSGVISVTVVHNDKVPMVPNFGQQPRFIVTIQPAGARFEPPARLALPNLEGLAPGEVTEMYSFDHDLGHFVSIGPATVSDDGSAIVSNPGVGVVKAGWHCGGNPASSGTVYKCPACMKCRRNWCVADTTALCRSCEVAGKACDGEGLCLSGKGLIPKICSQLEVVITNRRPLPIDDPIVVSTECRPGDCYAGRIEDLTEVTHSCGAVALTGAALTEEIFWTSTNGCPTRSGRSGRGCLVGPGNRLVKASGVGTEPCQDRQMVCPTADLLPVGTCTITLHQIIKLDDCIANERATIFTLTKTPDGGCSAAVNLGG